jgi:hypothetical protein
VGHFPSDRDLAEKAFRALRRYNGVKYYTGMQEHIVFASTDAIRSLFQIHNIPKGALVDLQKALRGSLGEEHQREWLGSAPNHPWKYVYFTEDDHILNARELTTAHTVLDDGGILIPHRMQPIPHYLDLQGILDHTKDGILVPESFQNGIVEDLYADTDSCCDTTEKPGSKLGPWRVNQSWWQCGFQTKEANHTLLESYEFIRFIEGTGIVSLAATEHSRQCVPSKNDRRCR